MPEPSVLTVTGPEAMRGAHGELSLPKVLVRQEDIEEAGRFSIDVEESFAPTLVEAEARRIGKRLASLDLGGFSPPQSEPPVWLSSQVDSILSHGNAPLGLFGTIAEQVIPKLVLAHGPGTLLPLSCPRCRLPPSESEVAEFAEIVTNRALEIALEFVEKLAHEGMSTETILLQLVAPSARMLGDQWNDDRKSFSDVTVGLGTLQQVTQVLGPRYAPGATSRGMVVLLAAPSEQHTLGLYLLGEFMRRAGWGVRVAPTMSENELLSIVGSERIEMVGISVSNPELTDRVAKLVSSVRRHSMNESLCVMIGGSVDCELDYGDLGATFCSDPRDAVRWLEGRATLRLG